jgi:hypothetical protein
MKKKYLLIILLLCVFVCCAVLFFINWKTNTNSYDIHLTISKILNDGGYIGCLGKDDDYYIGNTDSFILRPAFSKEELTDKDIEHIWLINCKKTHLVPQDICNLSKLQSIKSISFNNLTLTQSVIEKMSDNLNYLQNYFFEDVTFMASPMNIFIHSANIETLSFSKIDKIDVHIITSEGVKVENIYFIDTPITNQWLMTLLPLNELKVTFFFHSDISDDITDFFNECPRLEHIEISEENINCTFLRDIKETNSIKRIYLDKTNLSDEMVPYFSRFENLKQISISRTKITKKSKPFFDKLSQKIIVHIEWE